jgi:hypothetical protein
MLLLLWQIIEHMQFVVVYILLSIIAAYYGSKSRLGLWGILILSLIATPIVTLIVLFLFNSPAEKKVS